MNRLTFLMCQVQQLGDFGNIPGDDDVEDTKHGKKYIVFRKKHPLTVSFISP